MLPIIETIMNFITPILEFVRNIINFMPWEPEINYAIVAGTAGYFIGRSVEYLEPWKLMILFGTLIYVALMFI